MFFMSNLNYSDKLRVGERNGGESLVILPIQIDRVRLDKVRSIGPAVVILEIGTNDLSHSKPEVVGSNIDDLVHFLLQLPYVQIVEWRFIGRVVRPLCCQPANVAPLAPASAITPQQLQEIVSSATAEVTRRLQTVATPVPGVDEVPSNSPSGSAASVTESPIVRISEHVATPPTAVAQPAVYNAISVDDAADLAERLQQSFTKPWQNANPTEIPDVGELEHLQKNDTSPPLPSVGEIKVTLKHLNPRKATGSDGIHSWLLKRYNEELAPVIHNIICSSISQAKYPTLYKHAFVTPVAKIYPPNDMDHDFRQISVLPQLAKVLESIQLKLNKGDLKIKDNQHAFTHGRSTVSALATVQRD
ncbi:Hypothetical predicted protein [Paramuricea clavata]|uniref:Uncharacterized protein n=1 Tax=Paramuricea clavata TaxID=317549 RepID=A0A7D9EMM4_PARCT|nr:Hypothetical predicted protein [Paramuricea clavata]